MPGRSDLGWLNTKDYTAMHRIDCDKGLDVYTLDLICVVGLREAI